MYARCGSWEAYCESTGAQTQICLLICQHACMSNAILKSGKQIFRMRKPSKFNVPGWNERAKELNARYREAVSHWNIAGHPRSGPLAEQKCRARAALRNET